MPRYTTSGIPPQLASGESLGLSAFMPHFNRLAASGAQVYKYRTSGYPGTLAIPVSPYTQGVPPSPDPGDMAQMGLSRSSDAPNFNWPNLYYTAPDPTFDSPGGSARVQVYNMTRPQDTTMIPVPAIDLRGVYGNRSARLAGGVDNNRTPALKQVANVMRWGRRHVGNGSNQ